MADQKVKFPNISSEKLQADFIRQVAESHRDDIRHHDNEWQPIETAPKDETDVIVGVDIADTWIVRSAWYRSPELIADHAEYDPENWDASDVGWWSYRNSVSQEKLEGIYEPTHWIPLPSPPE